MKTAGKQAPQVGDTNTHFKLLNVYFYGDTEHVLVQEPLKLETLRFQANISPSHASTDQK